MGTQFLDVVIGRCTVSRLAKLTSIMFRFVALFALVAVAAAEPQFYQPWGGQSAAHLKTPSGDTVSVKAAKDQHHFLKATEYAKKGFLPYAGVVASPVAKPIDNKWYTLESTDQFTTALASVKPKLIPNTSSATPMLLDFHTTTTFITTVSM